MLRFTDSETTPFAVYITKLADGLGYSGLSPTLAVTNPDGTSLSVASPGLSAWEATIAPGLYKIEPAASIYSQTGVHIGQVDANDAGAITLNPFSFERVSSLQNIGVNRGRLAYQLADPVEMEILILKAADLTAFTGLSPTMRVVKWDGTEVTLTSTALSELSAANAPGIYSLSIPASDLDDADGGVEPYFVVVDPNDAAAKYLAPIVFERVYSVSDLSTGLCTLAEATAYIAAGQTTGTLSASQQALTQSLITRISAFIENTYCHRKFPQQTFTETDDGFGGQKHWVKNPPIISLTSVTINGVAQDLTQIEIDYETGELYHKAGVFLSWPPKAVTVVYQGGYATLPQELVAIACDMVSFKFTQLDRHRLGMTSEQAPDGSRTFYAQDFLPQHLEVLDNYRLSWGTASAVSYG